MHRLSIVASGAVLALVLGGCAASSAKTATASNSAAAAQSTPVYVHMNGGNHFLEPVVAVAPGQRVVFVNEDTGGGHTIVGYDPLTGAPSSAINGRVSAAPANKSNAPTYAVTFPKVGVYSYYCSLHSILAKTFGGAVQPSYRKGVDGFKGAMAGIIVVTTDNALVDANPPTTQKKIIPAYFGG